MPARSVAMAGPSTSSSTPQATIDEERAVFEAKLQKLADEANSAVEGTRGEPKT